MTAEQYAEELKAEWCHGTDLEGQLSSETWEDFIEKATAVIQRAMDSQYRYRDDY